MPSRNENSGGTEREREGKREREREEKEINRTDLWKPARWRTGNGSRIMKDCKSIKFVGATAQPSSLQLFNFADYLRPSSFFMPLSRCAAPIAFYDFPSRVRARRDREPSLLVKSSAWGPTIERARLLFEKWFSFRLSPEALYFTPLRSCDYATRHRWFFLLKGNISLWECKSIISPICCMVFLCQTSWLIVL